MEPRMWYKGSVYLNYIILILVIVLFFLRSRVDVFFPWENVEISLWIVFRGSGPPEWGRNEPVTEYSPTWRKSRTSTPGCLRLELRVDEDGSHVVRVAKVDQACEGCEGLSRGRRDTTGGRETPEPVSRSMTHPSTKPLFPVSKTH